MEFVGSIVRTGLAAAAGGLITNGVVDAETVNAVAGAIMVIVTAGWSLWQKKRAKEKLAAK